VRAFASRTGTDIFVALEREVGTQHEIREPRVGVSVKSPVLGSKHTDCLHDAFAGGCLHQ